jgi:ABC-type sugar transport system ATPase subunit
LADSRGFARRRSCFVCLCYRNGPFVSSGRVGNYETEHQRALVREVCAVVQTGRLVVVAGLVGSGKTHLLTPIEEELARSGKIAVDRLPSPKRRPGRGVEERRDTCRLMRPKSSFQ